MAIQYVDSYGFFEDNVTYASDSYSCSAGENRKLLVAAGAENSTGNINVNSVTYNGVGLTKIVEVDHSSPYNNLAWFYLDNADFPSTPGSYTVQANFSATVRPGIVMVIEITGAKQGSVDAYNSSEGSNVTSINTTITTLANNSWIIGAAISGWENTYTPASGQTERIDIQGLGGMAAACLGDEEIASAGATNMQWNTSVSVIRLLQILLAVSPAVARKENSVLMGTNF